MSLPWLPSNGNEVDARDDVPESWWHDLMNTLVEVRRARQRGDAGHFTVGLSFDHKGRFQGATKEIKLTSFVGGRR